MLLDTLNSGNSHARGRGRDLPGDVVMPMDHIEASHTARVALYLTHQGPPPSEPSDMPSNAAPTQRNTDHAMPKARGGNNTLENAQNTCRSCNLQKGTKTTEEYINGKP